MPNAARHAERIERAIARIEAGLACGEVPSLAQLAEAAAMSEFHFHRVYRVLTGETPQQTLARARLGGSLPALTRPEGIMGATERSAYATSQSYARALKTLTGATPGQLRDNPVLFAEVVEAVVRPECAGEGDARAISVEIVTLEPLRLAARRVVGDYEDLNAGYHQLFALLMQQMAPEKVTGLYGIPHDDPRDVSAEDCRFDCAVSTSIAVRPEGELTLIDVAATPSLRLRIPGDYRRVHAALDQLYRIAVALDLRIADVLPLNFYHHDPEEVATEELMTDIHLMLAE